MLRRKLIKKGLAKVMALTLAVSMAMPGTALAAAAQPPLDEATVEDVYEEDAAAEAVTIDETAEEAPALTDEGSEAEAPAEEAPADAEEEDAVEAAEDEAEPAEVDEDPADAEDESSPADTEEDSAVNGDNAAEEAPADTEEEVPVEEDVTDPAAQEDAAEPAAASPEMNEVTDVTINSDEYTVYLGLTGRKTYQMDIEVTYDTSTSYETNEPVFFKSSNENVLTVDSNGKVTAVGTGYAYVSVYTKTEYGEYNWTSQDFSVVETVYSVKFDLNGGTLADELQTEDESTYKKYKDGVFVRDGGSVSLTTSVWTDSGSISVANRDGYVFDGWSETKDGEENVGYSYYPLKDVTLYAVWKKAYTVKFDLNGGALADGLETDNASTYKGLKDGIVVAEGNGVSLPITCWNGSEYEDVAVLDGYRLTGWMETKDGTETVSNYYKPTKDITLYAKWSKLYSVKFDLNGGTLADEFETVDADDYKMITEGTVGAEDNYIYLPTSYWKDSEYRYVAVRDGYQLTGWTETKDGTETVNTYYYPKKDITLYAKWSKLYSIKFDMNGGKLADGLEAADASDYKMYSEGTTVAEGKSVYLDKSYYDGSESRPLAVRDGGYRFDGWTETKDGTETVKYSYSPTKDITLYAKWTRVCTVTFDTNTGTWASSYYEREYGNGYQAEINKPFYLPDYYDVTRSGYKLAGWTTTKNGTPVLTDKYTPTKDITLYAKWVKTFKVTFNAGEGYFGSDTSAKTKVLEIAEGKDIGNYLDYSSYTPRNGSKVFLGWYKNSALSDPAKKSDTITKDTTYYAKYETKVYKITVTNLKGASYTNHATGEYIYGDKSTAESYSYYISQGDAIGSLSADKDGENARFFYDQDCKTKPHYSRYVPTGNTTVYAKWNTEVTITWDADGGQNYSGKSTGTVDCKKNLMCENLPTELTKAGYYFVGWYDTADSSQKILPASHVFKANTTVKAKWATAIKITFKSGGGIFNPEGDPVIYIKAKTPVGEKMDFSIKREGYTLKGWKNSVTGKVVTAMYDEKPDKATTYTAVWEKETTATTVNVTLIAGDGSLYDYDNDRYVTKLVLKVAKNSTLGDGRFYYDLEHDEPYKKLDVDGWSLTKNGTALAASYKFTKDVTLYPLWAKNIRLTVALVTNGGAVNNRPSNTPRTYTTVKDGTIKLPNASNMEKEGFTFVGWYTDPAFKTKVSTPDAYKVTKSCYLYAKWKEGEPSKLGKTTRGDMFNLANNVKVTWKEVPGATYYKVYREGITDKSETQKDPVIVTTGLVGWDAQPGLTNGHAYRYRIVASTTGKGDSSGDSQLSYSKVMYRLKTVVIRSVKNTAAGTVTVTYDKTTSGDSYVLQYCERQDMVGAKTKVVLGASNTSYKITGLKKGKTYYISIRVRKKVDGIDYYTTFGVAKKVTITK